LKAISVISPWGDMITNGKKILEIRSWEPNIIPMKNIALVQNKIRLSKENQVDPSGQIIAVIDILDTTPWVQEDCRIAGCDETQFSEGYIAWRIGNVRKLTNPVNAVAKRKFYDLSDSEANSIRLEVDFD